MNRIFYCFLLMLCSSMIYADFSETKKEKFETIYVELDRVYLEKVKVFSFCSGYGLSLLPCQSSIDKFYSKNTKSEKILVRPKPNYNNGDGVEKYVVVYRSIFDNSTGLLLESRFKTYHLKDNESYVIDIPD